MALWSWNVETNRFTMDEQAFVLWGIPWAPEVMFEQLAENIHPSDRDRVKLAFEATLSAKGSFEIDFRILLDDVVRWVSARGQGGGSEIVHEAMYGIFLDVTGRKQAEEGNELLAGEMSHRVRNLLSIAAGLTNITYRSATSTEEMAKALTQRLTALGRAHDLVRPLPGGEGKAALLGDVFAVLLAPYDNQGKFAGRIRVAVARMGVGEAAAMTLALLIHELATNSLKHGALSSEKGVLDISTTDDGDRLTLTWTETGGPEILGAPALDGFGSRMVDRSLRQQFAGSMSYDWQSTGLVATLVMRKDRLAI